MKEGRLHSLMQAIGYHFKDTVLLSTALTHKSAEHKEGPSPHGHHNERLEFLGDAVLSLVAANYLYSHNATMNEGDLSRLRASYVCQDNLSLAAKALSLGEYIDSDKGMRASGSTNSKAILSDSLEALIGAVFIDGGIDAAQSVIFKVLGEPSNKVRLLEKDAKTKLQEIVQSSLQKAPKYVLLQVKGPAHAPTFLVGVKIDDEIIAEAFGENKKTAAQNAASIALEKLAMLKKGCAA